MSKFFKKSLAVAMTAAIVASTSTFAAFAVTDEEEVDTSMNTDSTVWVNGKDIKDNPKKGVVGQYYKTETYQQAGQYAGGKWAVQVTPKEIDGKEVDIATFLSKFDEKGKFDKTLAGKAKAIATAKIKDGKVTVTAGKESGSILVWVYEINSKKVVCNAKAGGFKADAVPANVLNVADVAPMPKEFTVKAAPAAMIPVAETYELPETGIADKKAKMKQVDVVEEETATFKIADTKVKPSEGVAYTIEVKDTAVATAAIEGDVVTVTGVKGSAKGAKTTVTVKNTQSGKAMKVNVVVKGKATVTIEGAKSGETVTYNDGSKDQTVKSGTKIGMGTKLKVTAGTDRVVTVTAAGKAVKADKDGFYVLNADMTIKFDDKPAETA